MSPKTALVLTLTASVALTAAIPAAAQGFGGPRGGEMIFEEFDLNNDGQITLEEMTNHREARFTQADTDGDGSLSRDEMIAAGQTRVEAGVDRMIERIDSDGDGAVSLAEMEAAGHERRESRQARMFDRIDADGDGAISAEEFEAAADRFRGRHGHGRDRG